MSNVEAFNVLHRLQKEIKAPKSQYNSFGKYHYRNCEDILEAVKPLLPDGSVILLNDDIEMIGDRIYVKATASLYTGGGHSISNTSYARESAQKKGMDESQITGAASSYARKYALNGLLLIDDNKDADSQSPEENAPQQQERAPEDDKEWFNDFDDMKAKFQASIKSGERTPQAIYENLKQNFKISKKTKEEILALGGAS